MRGITAVNIAAEVDQNGDGRLIPGTVLQLVVCKQFEQGDGIASGCTAVLDWDLGTSLWGPQSGDRLWPSLLQFLACATPPVQGGGKDGVKILHNTLLNIK